MQEYVCKDCVHYRQHYILSGEKLMKVYCGHCKRVRTKQKKPDTVRCEHFSLAESSVNMFVTKDYLTKELLQFVLGMDLLPEIKDFDGEGECQAACYGVYLPETELDLHFSVLQKN